MKPLYKDTPLYKETTAYIMYAGYQMDEVKRGLESRRLQVRDVEFLSLPPEQWSTCWIVDCSDRYKVYYPGPIKLRTKIEYQFVIVMDRIFGCLFACANLLSEWYWSSK